MTISRDINAPSVVFVPEARYLIAADSRENLVVSGEIDLHTIANRWTAVAALEVTLPTIEERVVVKNLLWFRETW